MNFIFNTTISNMNHKHHHSRSIEHFLEGSHRQALAPAVVLKGRETGGSKTGGDV